MQKILLIISISLSLFSCKNNKGAVNTLEDMQESEVILADTVHNSQNSLDWKGTYRGVTPCADCMGILFEITLNDDGTYNTRSIYLGKSDSVYSQSGRYQWDKMEQRIICRINNKIVTRFKVGENYLEQVGSIEGSESNQLQKHYNLYKNQSAIQHQYWIATEIMGRKVSKLQLDKEPYLLIKKESFSASGGCNSIFGGFSILEKGKTIQFSDIAASERICTYEHFDNELIDVLRRSERFVLKNGDLQLLVGKAAPLAKFKAVLKK